MNAWAATFDTPKRGQRTTAQMRLTNFRLNTAARRSRAPSLERPRCCRKRPSACGISSSRIGRSAAHSDCHASTSTRHGSSMALSCSRRARLRLERPSGGEVLAASSGAAGENDFGTGDLPSDFDEQQLRAQPGEDRVLSEIGKRIEPGNRLVSLDVQLDLPT